MSLPSRHTIRALLPGACRRCVTHYRERMDSSMQYAWDSGICERCGLDRAWALRRVIAWSNERYDARHDEWAHLGSAACGYRRFYDASALTIWVGCA